MSDITRDDLRVLTDRERPDHWPEGIPWFMPPTDEEFDRLAQEAGYVKMNHDIATLMMDWLHDNPGKALGALLTDKCETCGGSGFLVQLHEGGQANLECPKCGGRGWIPKDGIEPRLSWVTGKARQMLAIPLDWLEAEDEQ